MEPSRRRAIRGTVPPTQLLSHPGFGRGMARDKGAVGLVARKSEAPELGWCREGALAFSDHRTSGFQKIGLMPKYEIQGYDLFKLNQVYKGRLKE